MKDIPREVPKIFISYAREDKDVADELYILLRQNMFSPWMDKPPEPYALSGLLPGENWDMRIMYEIRKSKYILLLLSKTSVGKRGFVQREVRAALDKLNELAMDQIAVIPILLDEMEIPDIRVGFQSLAQIHCLRTSRLQLRTVTRYLETIEIRDDESPQHSVYEIYNPNQFVELIGNNRTLKICCEKLNLSTINEVDNPKVFMRKEYNGNDLIIRNCVGLKIEGSNKNNLICVEPSHVTVLTFSDCHSLGLSNIRLGHWPDQGHCTGGVLSLSTCIGTDVYNCDLFGCGADGLQMTRVIRFSMSNSTIRDCSYGIMQIQNCMNINFDNCNFLNNKEFYGVDLQDVNDIRFFDCQFIGNQTNTELISIQSCNNVFFISCKEESNVYTSLRSDGMQLNTP